MNRCVCVCGSLSVWLVELRFAYALMINNDDDEQWKQSLFFILENKKQNKKTRFNQREWKKSFIMDFILVSIFFFEFNSNIKEYKQTNNSRSLTKWFFFVETSNKHPDNGLKTFQTSPLQIFFPNQPNKTKKIIINLANDDNGNDVLFFCIIIFCWWFWHVKIFFLLKKLSLQNKQTNKQTSKSKR